MNFKILEVSNTNKLMKYVKYVIDELQKFNIDELQNHQTLMNFWNVSLMNFKNLTHMNFWNLSFDDFKAPNFMQIDSLLANTTWEKIAKAFWIPDNKLKKLTFMSNFYKKQETKDIKHTYLLVWKNEFDCWKLKGEATIVHPQ
jgi:hypothetical protein